MILIKLNQFLTSIRLTLGLLLCIALASAIGTLNRPEDGRFDLYFQNPFFRLLFLLLAINLLACTIKTIRRNLNDRQRNFAALAATIKSGIKIGTTVSEVTRERLQALGYHVEVQDQALLGTRHRYGRWGSTIVHLSCLIIMLGAVCAGFGFTGTLNLLTGAQSSVYFDWKSQTDLPLGFEFRLDRFEPIYYPIELQFAMIDPATGRELAVYTTREGATVPLPDGMSVKVVRYFFYEEDLVLDLYKNGIRLGEYHALGGKRVWEKNPIIPVAFKPVAFRDPLLAQLRSEVSILQGEKVVQRGVIQMNEPLTFDGINIYQTVYNRDKYGYWSAGFQFTRDPGKPFVWFGCITLALGLALAFFVPCQMIGVINQQLVIFSGFHGEAGQLELLEIKKFLEQTE